MKLIVCVDTKNGMSFFTRRQSRDAVVCDRILQLSDGAKLFMSGYSADLFEENENIIPCHDFMNTAGEDDFCFAESKIQSLDKVENLYIFNWNRHYPADVFFDFDLEKEGFVLEKTEEFAGNSHDKITLNVYKRS